ncbi:endonuclease/exonuclease/phosphatase family protein [Paramicrobacterium agarici]|uniref:Endonuclease/exonuclease/phosphatase family metal-dependent hydrolase n=1 Tax=Paramicrobacterium agarici TaxID=630514 RepID=A0A2A9E0A4_9MICO|nr:endonuclease/exonuclease/phosphatase family protein [Microbacterium agarici]PFG31652.1 endonuclease/exonuclease/phosphatase family metal-dependent hydrolase [Microbacterium agarici]
MGKFLGAIVTLAVLVALIILAWPQAAGLETTWIVAQAVALRTVLAVGAAALALVLLVLCFVKPIRGFAGSLAALLLIFAVAVAGIAAVRGIGVNTTASSRPDDVTVLTWNTLGDEPGADAIADLAVESGADIVTLPETTKQAGIDIAVAMREAGQPMWVHTVAFDDVAKARSTTVLVSPELGDYRQVSSSAERSDNTAVLPSVVLEPVNDTGPRIVAVHAVAPTQTQMDNWRADLAWLADQCSGDNVIMAGDFNATIDHMAALGVDGADLGRCTDAATLAGAGSVGTWSTAWPALFGAPIDHVMVTNAWKVSGFRVATDHDASGSDHRPVIAHLRPMTAS